jgi:hypothetical protein
MTVSASEGRAWGTLGELLSRRRVELDPRYKVRTLFATERSINERLAFDIEKAPRTRITFTVPRLAEIARAYAVTYDSITRVLDEGADHLQPSDVHAQAAVAGAGALAPPPAILSGGAAVPDEREELRDLLAQAELEARVAELEDQIRAEIRAAERDGRDPFPGDELSAQVWAAHRPEEYRIAALALIRMAARRQKNPVRRAG